MGGRAGRKPVCVCDCVCLRLCVRVCVWARARVSVQSAGRGEALLEAQGQLRDQHGALPGVCVCVCVCVCVGRWMDVCI